MGMDFFDIVCVAPTLVIKEIRNKCIVSCTIITIGENAMSTVGINLIENIYIKHSFTTDFTIFNFMLSPFI